MDPNAALQLCRARAADLVRVLDAGHYDDCEWNGDTDAALDATNQLVEAFQGLDQWISRGGFLPAAWQVSP